MIYLQLKEKYGQAADYILTNSHCRAVVMKMNLREFYHFVRLRSDEHTQWDIRSLSHQLLQKVKEIMPFRVHSCNFVAKIIFF
jgi:thymidylate synthase ThyX